MENNIQPSWPERLRTLIIGRERSLEDRGIFHKLSLIAFFAWVGLGADGLSSSCYGPEEAFLALKEHAHLSIFVALASVVTISVISASYSQIIELFPTGGGGYLVASKLLSPTFGMIAGSALIVDYMLTITISIASGADALFSLMPPEWQAYKLDVALVAVVILTVLNLRGVKESIVPLVPIFMTFVLTHVFVIIYAVMTHLFNFSEVVAATKLDIQNTHTELGWAGMFFLLLRAYSLGAGTYTGIEAVSNGVPILREPKVETARRTMRYMAISLSFMVLGLMLAYLLYQVTHQTGKTLNAVLVETMTATWNNTIASTFVTVTLISEAALLFIAAQTGFLDGPRVLANMALDRWVPTRFAMLSDRLVAQNGILIMGGTAFLIMMVTRGKVSFLVVLYSINVFVTFVLAQSGMVRHWWNCRREVAEWRRKLLINGIGLVLAAFILVSVTFLKFHEGGWITLIVTGAIVAGVVFIRRHYDQTGRMIRRLDNLVTAIKMGGAEAVPETVIKQPENPQFDPNAKTAILLVNGFTGLGLHALFNIFHLFGDSFKNFLFIQVGVVDAGVFKGAAEIEHLQRQVKADLDRYIELMKNYGYYAESMFGIGTDVVDEVAGLAPEILKRFRQVVFFGGQLVFPKDTLLLRWLHNTTVYEMQRRLYHQGIPFVILPVRV